MRKIAASAMLLLALAFGLAGCGKSADELASYAQQIGLPTEGSVPKGQILHLGLTQKCKGDLYYGTAPGALAKQVYFLNVQVKGKSMDEPSVAVLSGTQVSAFAAKLKDPSKGLPGIAEAAELQEACW